MCDQSTPLPSTDGNKEDDEVDPFTSLVFSFTQNTKSHKNR